MNKTFLKKYFPIFVLPTLLAFVISWLIPFFYGIYLSFTKFTVITDKEWVGIQNYKNIFIDDQFTHSLLFTALFSVVSVVMTNILAFALAYLLTRGLKGSYFFRTVFFMPNLIGGIVLGYVWQMIINGVLQNFNLTITFDSKYGFWGLIILYSWQMIGYLMVIYIAGLQNIPGELNDAAAVDGAGAFQKIRSITLPLIMPSISINLFLTLTNSFKLFDQNLALTNGAPANQSAMVALDIYSTIYNRQGFAGVGQAKAVLFTVLVGIIALTQVALTKRKEVES
jgi:raffinose/stachyose/melibiose transport system permease protein